MNYTIGADLADLVGEQFLDFDPTKVVRRPIGSDYILIDYYGMLEVFYKKINWAYSPYADAPYQVSTIKFLSPLRCSKHGYVFDPMNYEVTGYHINSRIAKILPFEYGSEK